MIYLLALLLLALIGLAVNRTILVWWERRTERYWLRFVAEQGGSSKPVSLFGPLEAVQNASSPPPDWILQQLDLKYARLAAAEFEKGPPFVASPGMNAIAQYRKGRMGLGPMDSLASLASILGLHK